MNQSKAAWFFIGAIFLCGPVALGRLEVFSLALTILAAISFVKRRESTSMQFFNFATWIKVSPVAGIFTGFIVSEKKIRFVLLMVAINKLKLLNIGLVAGAKTF
jgi:hypothetical protein